MIKWIPAQEHCGNDTIVCSYYTEEIVYSLSFLLCVSVPPWWIFFTFYEFIEIDQDRVRWFREGSRGVVSPGPRGLCRFHQVPAVLFRFIHGQVRGMDKFFRSIDGGCGNAGNADADRDLPAIHAGELMKVDGRTLTFHLRAEDEREAIGEGVHERIIIDVGRFDDRMQIKLADAQLTRNR